jgi:hypothetical protein
MKGFLNLKIELHDNESGRLKETVLFVDIQEISYFHEYGEETYLGLKSGEHFIIKMDVIDFYKKAYEYKIKFLK